MAGKQTRRSIEVSLNLRCVGIKRAARCRIGAGRSWCSQGLQNKDVAERLRVHEHTVGKRRRRSVQVGIEGLTDEYRTGRPPTVSDAQVAEVVERTLNTTPKDGTHWSIRSVAADSGLSHTTIRRIWTAFGRQPHRAETFKLSSDPHCANER